MRRHGQPARAPQPHPIQHECGEYAFLVGSLDRPRHLGAWPRRRRSSAAWRPTRCCWRQGGSRSSTMRPPWRAASACPSSPGMPSSISPMRSHWPAAEVGLPARLAGRPCRVLAATQAPPAMLSSATWQRCGRRASTWSWRPSSSSMRRWRRMRGPERIDRAVRGLLRAAAGELGRRSGLRPGR